MHQEFGADGWFKPRRLVKAGVFTVRRNHVQILDIDEKLIIYVKVHEFDSLQRPEGEKGPPAVAKRCVHLAEYMKEPPIRINVVNGELLQSNY